MSILEIWRGRRNLYSRLSVDESTVNALVVNLSCYSQVAGGSSGSFSQGLAGPYKNTMNLKKFSRVAIKQGSSCGMAEFYLP